MIPGMSIQPPSVGKIINDERVRRINQKNAEEAFWREAKLQRDFAQQGIQWKVADAKAAGIHPLYALGAQTHSFSPTNTFYAHQPSDISGGAISFQNLNRAQQQTETELARQDRLQQLQVERAELENLKLSSEIARLNQSQAPGLPSHSGLSSRLIDGQGNSAPTSGGYVIENPMQRTHSSPGRPAQEVGAVPDYGFARTPTGYALVPSKDVKEKIEDQLIPEISWAIRNQLLPNFYMGPTAPDPRYYPLPEGYNEWKWHHLSQEFRPYKDYYTKDGKHIRGF